MPKNATTALFSTTLPDLLTRAEAADAARVSLETLKRWIAAGHLPTVRPGGRVLVRRDALAAYLEACSTTATAGPLAGRRA